MTTALGRDLTWIKSSYSNAAGGECVECAWSGRSILVRDSKSPETSRISVSTRAWGHFLATSRE